MSVANPGLQIRGSGQLDSEVRRGGGQSPKKFLSVLRPSFLSKNRGGGTGARAPSLDPPLSVVAVVSVVCAVVQLLQLLNYTLTIRLPCFIIDEIK